MKTIHLLILSISLFAFSCENSDPKNDSQLLSESKQEDLKKISVLNFGTFHMGFSSDANTTEFDENDKSNQKKVHAVAKELSLFEPTIIIVETVPENDQKIQNEYKDYVVDPTMKFKNPSEIELLAYELGRICDTKRIYGIDHKMGYNYNIGTQMKNDIDALWHDSYYKDPLSFYPEVNVNRDSLSLLDKLKQCNHDKFLDFLITVNADMLAHVGSEKGFEGADEATKYYQRNLRMYSNLNRIEMNEKDRVFILMGASHTAFFRDFMSRSPKYKMVNTFDYLK